MNRKYIILDIETCPISLENYFEKDEEEKLKLLNPIDSRIVAIGLRFENVNYIFQSEDEKEILSKFWEKWKEIKLGSALIPVVGFNITSFDMPFIVTRSFIQNIRIESFSLKEIIDLRDKINAYKYGKTRGKLKEFAEIIGQEILEVNGSDVSRLCYEKDYLTLNKYLEKDLEITDALYKRAVETNVINVNRY
ncbi:MAG: 3'-5' exonuclease [archaeon]|jgi:uncharacterized protein YprB with RNaseH-like and TPR domain|nr:ribonuclease H-like domain-containing protein [archaeon]MDD2477376.1 3'-5' exonuclease [Candidatus ainarchaeum sp.]MDD3084511.1 3'-5' exonuclease [Candidatus ainarchaeum sp.]MDD4220792.1 3'-5' exonuclease [Candidatus ainarchaeum sp.]MDD4662291.1 3'-5' exonuclease [Candidatus ainarchaeum sp.]